MKILVCVKQVPDTSGKVAVNPDGTLNRASMQTIINPDDMNAVEAALKLKDELGCTVTVVTMGPPPAEGMLRELMAMGADDGYLVSAREFGGSDTYATSQILAAAIDTIGLDDDDIVFCGRQAIDGDTAQVGPQIAEKLHLPQITYAADITKDGDTLTVKRMLEDGYMTIKAHTPCLITCIKELNTPRYMSVSGVFECYSKPMNGPRLQRPEGSSPDRRYHHRPQGLPDQHPDLLHAPSEGRWPDARGQRHGYLREARWYPARKTHHLRKGDQYDA